MIKHQKSSKGNVMKCLIRYIFRFINPNTTFFPIYWFPILIPIFINALAILIDIAMIPQQGTAQFTLVEWENIIVSTLRSFQLAFLSTDIWALTTILMYSAKAKLHGMYVWAHSFAVILGIFAHLLFYLSIIVFAKHESALVISIILFIVGFFGVMLIRGTILFHIESKEIEEFGALDYSNPVGSRQEIEKNENNNEKL